MIRIAHLRMITESLSLADRPVTCRRDPKSSQIKGRAAQIEYRIGKEFRLTRRFGSVSWAAVWTYDQLEYSDVGLVHPILQRVTANRTGCMTGVRRQEFLGSAVVLSAAIVTPENCRHSENMRPRSPVIQYGWLA
jgi:hypothetical protein